MQNVDPDHTLGVGLLWARRQFSRGDLREADCQQVLIVSANNPTLPMPPILAQSISFEEALASKGECLVKSRREVGQCEPLGVHVNDTRTVSDVEVVQSRSIDQR